jgi:hypothetical protein
LGQQHQTNAFVHQHFHSGHFSTGGTTALNGKEREKRKKPNTKGIRCATQVPVPVNFLEKRKNFVPVLHDFSIKTRVDHHAHDPTGVF